MGVRLVFDGLVEFKEALRQLVPENLAEAETIIHGAAADAYNRMSEGYAAHTRSGALAKGLSLKVEHSGKFGVGVVLRNRAPHAWFFEHGTETRKTALGANRGRMPPTHIFIPEMERARREVRAALVGLLERQGLTVINAA
jgi:hypothetical protein